MFQYDKYENLKVICQLSMSPTVVEFRKNVLFSALVNLIKINGYVILKILFQ